MKGLAPEDMVQNALPIGFIPVNGRRVALRNQSLLNLVAAAYRIRMSDISGPSWMSNERFDIDATTPDGVPSEQTNEMLQSLLEERFGLKLHREDQLEPGYALVVGKTGPKLTLSEPDSVSTSDASAGAAESRAAGLAKRGLRDVMPGRAGAEYSRITADGLADALSRWVDSPVVNMTGLKGEYHIVLAVSTSTSDQESGDSIFRAVEKLGLKLEPRKVRVTKLVVDQLAKIPTPN